MKIGIVGAEAKKFRPDTETSARIEISNIGAAALKFDGVQPTIVSGRCHLGGIDIWAEYFADHMGWPKEIYPPKDHRWETGYKPRNIKIATASDIVYCITVKELPKGYLVESWNRKPCYHCARRGFPFGEHVKSGGCWTAWYAIERLGKEGRWILI